MEKVKSELQYEVLAPWCSDPVGTFKSPCFFVFFVFEKGMFACERSLLSLAKDLCIWCPGMAINVVSVQYNGGFFPDYILLTGLLCDYTGEPF